MHVATQAAPAVDGQENDPRSQEGQPGGEESTGPPESPVIPLPYVVGDDGKKQPLPGVQSIFLRGMVQLGLLLYGIVSARSKQIRTTVQNSLAS